ncbi:hypothetical protein JCM19045_4778 [Bacillus sp. JCM 19045]|nr:hypothetical protein JCM19045_4778 [Bacillus sp. JCM 19045]
MQEEPEEESELPVVQEEPEEENKLPVVQEEPEKESELPVVQEESEEEKSAVIAGVAAQQAGEGPNTRAERRKAREAEEAEAKERENPPVKKQRIRLIPIWLRLIIITVLAGAALILGMVIGFGVVGDGENMWDVLNPDLWYNLIDTIRGD